MPNRKSTEVRLPANSWLKRYWGGKWDTVPEYMVSWELERYFPGDSPRLLHNMRDGRMNVTTKYAEYAYLHEAEFEDELPHLDDKATE